MFKLSEKVFQSLGVLIIIVVVMSMFSETSSADVQKFLKENVYYSRGVLDQLDQENENTAKEMVNLKDLTISNFNQAEMHKCIIQQGGITDGCKAEGVSEQNFKEWLESKLFTGTPQ